MPTVGYDTVHGDRVYMLGTAVHTCLDVCLVLLCFVPCFGFCLVLGFILGVGLVWGCQRELHMPTRGYGKAHGDRVYMLGEGVHTCLV